jgi:hypothetical protein
VVFIGDRETPLRSRPMGADMRYYFDQRDWEGLSVDDEGMDLRSMEAVQKEATNSMTEVMREVLRWPIRAGEISIEVRDDKGQVMCIRFSIEFEVGRKN